MADNPFADLIPKASGGNPFADLIPQGPSFDQRFQGVRNAPQMVPGRVVDRHLPAPSVANPDRIGALTVDSGPPAPTREGGHTRNSRLRLRFPVLPRVRH